MEYTWGVVMLGQLYHDICVFLYQGYKNLGTNVTLLHIWAWDNIAMTLSLGVQDWCPHYPYVDRCRELLHYTQVGVCWFWRQILDEITVFT